MNVLYHFRTRGAGAERVHVAGMAGAMQELGHPVTFSSPTGMDPLRQTDASPYAGKAGFWRGLSKYTPQFLFELLEIAYNVPAWLRNRRLLKKGAFGMIYERHAYFLFSTALLKKRFGLPMVVEVNELVGEARVRKEPYLSFLIRRLDRFVFRRADLIVVVSPHLKRKIVELGIPEERVLVEPNAVNRREYETPADGSGVRAQFGAQDALTVGFVGWFVHWHGLEWLVDAVCRLAAEFPRLRLLMVGDGPLRQELTARAEEQGAGDRLIFTGAVDHQEIPRYIAAMDVAVIPNSNAYRSPIKLFEYMGQGCAVLAPATEPIRMVVRDQVNGALFPVGDAEALTASLRDLLADEERRAMLGAQAREDVLAKHTWRHNAQAVLERIGRAPPA